MTAKKILQALEEFDGGLTESSNAARAGFLEWAFNLPRDTTAKKEADRVLCNIDTGVEHADAARMFLRFLRDASEDLPQPIRRGGAIGRRRLLH